MKEKEFEKISAAIETTVGNQLELALDASYRQNKWFMISGGYSLYDERNLHGERLIPSLEHGSVYHEFNLRVSLLY